MGILRAKTPGMVRKENRRGRLEPRMVKRRPKAFPRLQKPRSFYDRKVA